MTLYKILRALLQNIYRFWYNPKVIGSENIPKTGSIIIAGNHMHLMDQFDIIISTRRCIHYMAKKEYFSGSFAWFFKNTGCIPVDRSKKDEEATNRALEVLEHGHCLGIFPEGTRNKLKEERIKELHNKYFYDKDYESFYQVAKKSRTSQVDYLEKLYNEKVITADEFRDNVISPDFFLWELVKEKRISKEDYYNNLLLPFKFGAVSMAHKTSSYIVPCAVTGDYKFRSKDLTIRIGKPFQVEEDLEKANLRLREEILSLLKENLNNNGK